MSKHGAAQEHQNTERWLITYADLMNNMLVLFMVLYIMSVMDLTKFEKLAASFSKTLLGTSTPEVTENAPQMKLDDLTAILSSGILPTNAVSIGAQETVKPSGDEEGEASAGPEATQTPAPSEGASAIAEQTPEPVQEATPVPQGGESSATAGPTYQPDASATQIPSDVPMVPASLLPDGTNGPSGNGIGYYDMSAIPTTYEALFQKINYLLEESNYGNQVSVEKVGGAINLRFREGVFFYPNKAELKQEGYPVLDSISKIILESYDLISEIEISGHTARISEPNKNNLFSWDLSTDRALLVLKYLVQECNIPQDKLSVAGYSSNQPFVAGSSEEFWAQNRRVEIRLTQKKDDDTDIVGQ